MGYSGIEKLCNSTFWDEDLMWNTDNPDFTECFQKTALVYAPCGFLWVFGCLYLISVFTTKRSHFIPLSFLNISKSILCVALICLCIADLVVAVKDGAPNVDIVMSSLFIPTFAFCLVLIQIDKLRGNVSSLVLFFFWFLLIVCGAITCRSLSQKHMRTKETTTRFVLFMVYYPLVCIQWILSCLPDKPKPPDIKPSIKPCPESTASALGRVTFSWMDSLMWKGFRNPLVVENLYDLKDKHKAAFLSNRFGRHLGSALKMSNVSGGDETIQAKKIEEQKGKIMKKQKVSLLRPLFKEFGPTVLKGFCFRTCYDCLLFVNPHILNLVLDYLDNKEMGYPEEEWKGLMYSGLMFVMASILTLLSTQYFNIMMIGGMRIKTALIAMIYKKALIISNASRKNRTVGEIVNLMSVDAQRFVDVMTYLGLVVSFPIQIALSLYFLYVQLGVAVITGVVVMLIIIPSQLYLSAKQRSKQMSMMKIKDERAKMMNEILNGMKVLKLYAWEPSFEALVTSIRERELKLIKDIAILMSGTIVLMTVAPFLVGFGTFTTYVLLDDNNILTANVIFVSMSLLGIFSMSLNMFPMVLTFLIQAGVSTQRMNKFLNSAKLDDDAVSHNPSKDAIQVDAGCFSWAPDDEDCLRDINLQVHKGSLVGVVGEVGSGKSSLVSALLGEMEKTKGSINVDGSIAYIPQQAWIQNATVRENILFGKSYQQKWYDKVIEACALQPDFEILSAGDKTEIGEKGINLSGGQKQRVSVARAVYSDSDIVFLDDPLSAVDSHVGAHLFNRVIGKNGLLATKTRILVTHALSYLPNMDMIYVLKGGRISEQGTYQQLLESNQGFSELLKEYVQEETKAEEDGTSMKTISRQVSKMSTSSVASALSRRSSKKIINERRKESVFSRNSIHRTSKGSLKREREASIASDVAIPDAHLNTESKEESDGRLIATEAVETGGVSFTIIKYYMQCIGYFTMLIILIGYIGSYAFKVGSDMWLTKWSASYSTWENGSQYMEKSKRNKFIGVYAALGSGQALLMFGGDIIRSLGMMVAGRVIHYNLLVNILHCPMSFFDTTPLGRIINRFSKDIDVIDSTLPASVRSMLWTISNILGTLFTIIYATPIFTAVIVPLAIVFVLLQRFYVATSNQLRRLESVTRSPIYSLFSETLNGVSSIRAYNDTDRFINNCLQMIDRNQRCYYPYVSSNRWLSIRLETMGNLVVFFAALLAVRGNLAAGLAGMSITYSQSVTQVLNWLVRMSSEAETNIVAVERLLEYTNEPNEAKWDVPETKPPQEWPDEGNIQFDNYETRYREGLDLVLRGISCNVQSGEKVGIVGRTGAGKSSLTLALFRIIEPSAGTILIDGLDISKLGLHALRSKITIIPQDPVLFSGSLRMNLDPFEQFRDSDIWEALELAHLKNFVSGLDAGLAHKVSEGGENLSVGQRQLVCLARALLRKTKVLVLDEATAAVDLETDQLIQNTIRSQFDDCSILTIAHRLNTVLDYDKVMVLDQGLIREYDSPENLLRNTESIFFSMAKAAQLV